MRITDVAPLMVVRDVARSVAFYRRLGFAATVEWPTRAKLSAGAGTLHLAAPGDCRAACAALVAAGVELLADPVEPEWGGEVRAFPRGPDGHPVELNETLG